MKNFKAMINRTKILIVLLIFAIFGLSFLFSDSIENALGLRKGLNDNQVLAENVAETNYEVTYIDVGQGNSTLIRFPDGKIALIDCGNEIYGEKVARLLTQKGITQIDFLIATHSDSDHIGGFNYILDFFEVKNVYRPFQIAGTGTTKSTFVVWEDEDLATVYKNYLFLYTNPKISRVSSSIYRRFITKIYNETYTENDVVKNCAVTVFYHGLEIVGEGYSIKFYFPEINYGIGLLIEESNTFGYGTYGYGASDSNSCSAIFLVKIGDEKFFFTGDSPWTSGGTKKSQYAETDFVENLSPNERDEISNVSVYLVGHHGSAYSSSTQLLNLIRPRFSVVSVGEVNTYGHPADSCLERLSATPGKARDYLIRTDKSGTISFFLIDGKLKYTLEKYELEMGLQMSWFELGTVLFITISIIVFNIKDKKSFK